MSHYDTQMFIAQYVYGVISIFGICIKRVRAAFHASTQISVFLER